MTFSVTVRDHIMIAHSLRGEVFGPAQKLHGATYVVDASFEADTLDSNGIVIDIGVAAGALEEITAALSYRNLDDEPDLSGINTTTERLCQLIVDRLAAMAGEARFAPAQLTGLTVTLHESHVAWASYRVSL
jgi:6-pyruvoyl-tetrahydropterin synthase